MLSAMDGKGHSSTGPRRLGDPLDMPPAAPGGTKAHFRGMEDNGQYRRGDRGLGQPNFTAAESRPLTEEELVRHRAEEDRRLREEFARKVESLRGMNEFWPVPQWMRRILLVTLLVGASVLGLLVTVELSRFVSTFASLPVPFNWVGAAGAALFGGILLCVTGWMFWQLARLKRSPAVRLEALTILAEREKWRQLALIHAAEAKDRISAHLREYPLSTQHLKRLFSIGMTEAECGELAKARDRLLDNTVPMTPKAWLHAYASQFQGIQDDAAKRRIRQYAFRVGAGTATSPLAALDQMIILYSSMALIRDLLCLYQVRPAFGQTGLLLARAVLNTYLGGLIEGVTENAAESVADSVHQMTGEIFGGSVLRTLGAKAAEAGLNGYLLHRLGNSTTRMLRPVEEAAPPRTPNSP
jgi:uncharacterized membrane protein YcjF (UPF0283 family)